METLQGILHAHPFFADLPTRHGEIVAGCASNVRFPADTFIFGCSRRTSTISEGGRVTRQELLIGA